MQSTTKDQSFPFFSNDEESDPKSENLCMLREFNI